jgi:hypothetical protein
MVLALIITRSYIPALLSLALVSIAGTAPSGQDADGRLANAASKKIVEPALEVPTVAELSKIVSDSNVGVRVARGLIILLFSSLYKMIQHKELQI